MIPEVLSFPSIMSAMYVCTNLFEDSKCLQTYVAAVSRLHGERNDVNGYLFDRFS